MKVFLRAMTEFTAKNPHHRTFAFLAFNAITFKTAVAKLPSNLLLDLLVSSGWLVNFFKSFFSQMMNQGKASCKRLGEPLFLICLPHYHHH